MSFPRIIVAEILAFWVGAAAGIGCLVLLADHDAIARAALIIAAFGAVLSRELTLRLAQRCLAGAMRPTGFDRQALQGSRSM